MGLEMLPPEEPVWVSRCCPTSCIEQHQRLQAAAENILFKRKQGVPLEAVDFEWLERAVGGKDEY